MAMLVYQRVNWSTNFHPKIEGLDPENPDGERSDDFKGPGCEDFQGSAVRKKSLLLEPWEYWLFNDGILISWVMK